MTGIQSLLVRIYGYDDSHQNPWGIVKIIGQSAEYHFHTRRELLELLISGGNKESMHIKQEDESGNYPHHD